MAHFIGFVNGNRGEASRLGSKDSGMSAVARGWDIGGRVFVSWNDELQMDVVNVEVDRGSNGSGASKYLGSFVVHPKTGEIVPFDYDEMKALQAK